MASHRKARPPKDIRRRHRQLVELYLLYQRPISYAMLFLLTVATVALAAYTVVRP